MHASSTIPTSSAPSSAGASLAALTGVDVVFDSIVDSIVSQMKTAVSPRELRMQLQAFRPRFEAIYSGLVQQYLGSSLADLSSALSQPDVRAYFEAQRSMAPQLGQMLQQLSHEMGNTEL
jgi:hypothetical protein